MWSKGYGHALINAYTTPPHDPSSCHTPSVFAGFSCWGVAWREMAGDLQRAVEAEGSEAKEGVEVRHGERVAADACHR